jgi:hypothetical protein
MKSMYEQIQSLKHKITGRENRMCGREEQEAADIRAALYQANRNALFNALVRLAYAELAGDAELAEVLKQTISKLEAERGALKQQYHTGAK